MHLGHQWPQGETLAACTSLLLSIESATVMPGRVQEEVKDEVEIKLLLVAGRTMRRIGRPVMSPRLVVQNSGLILGNLLLLKPREAGWKCYSESYGEAFKKEKPKKTGPSKSRMPVLCASNWVCDPRCPLGGRWRGFGAVTLSISNASATN